MCGILGAIGNFDSTAFAAGLDAIAHRGPDGADVLYDDSVKLHLGHRRLAILEIGDSGKQPMTDGSLTIIFNGEIYNYRELRSELESKGHRFTTKNSDTEVILKAYREYGKDCLSRFNGMWAFAIWDSEKKSLFLARDRFGVKPLFYSHTKNGFVFGSEMKAIAPMLDSIAISNDFFWCSTHIYEYESSSKSLIEGIKRFPAGHYGFLEAESKHNLIVTRYWDTLENLEEVSDNYPAQIEKFRSLFFDACKVRMRADVPIGTALSGGLDSSSVAAAMHHLGKVHSDTAMSENWQNAFVATFTGTVLDEKIYAEEVVNSLNLKGHYFEIDAEKSLQNFSNDLWLFEELYLTSPAPMIEVYKGVKSAGVTVSLDGHGADELLAGYGTTMFNTIKDSPLDFRNIKNVIDTFKGLRGVDKSSFELLVDGFGGRKNLIIFYLNRMINSVKHEDEIIRRLGYFNGSLFKDFHHNILPTLLRNYDRYSMAASVEVRMPFLDYRLVTYSFSLPWTSKLNGGFTKSILRDAIAPFLSDKVVRRKHKIGFGTPFTNWLKGPWKSFIFDTISSQSFKNSTVINPSAVTEFIDRFYANSAPTFEDGHKVWEMLMPYFWEISFFNRLKMKHNL